MSKKFLVLLMGLFMFSMVSATWSNTTFNNNLGSENITLINGTNYTRYLQVPQNTFVVNSSINLNGYTLSRGTNIDHIYLGEGFISTGITSYDNKLWALNSTASEWIIYEIFINNESLTGRTIDTSGQVTSGRGITTNGTFMWVIGDSTSNIYKYWLNGTYTGDTFTMGSSGQGLTSNETHLFINRFTGSNDLQIYDFDGNFINQYSIQFPTYGIAYSENLLYVGRTDSLSKIYTTTGVDIGFGGFSFNTSNTLARDMHIEGDRLYVSNGAGNLVYVYNQNQSNTTNFNLYIGSELSYSIPGEFIGTNYTTNLNDYVNTFMDSCTPVSGFCYVPFNFVSEGNGRVSYSSMTFTNNGFNQNFQIYNSSTIETSTEEFIIDLEYDSDNWNSITAKLNYGGNNYTGTSEGTGDNINFTSTINIPTVTSDTNKNFFWYVTLTNSTGSFVFNSPINSQSVTNLGLGICSPGNTPIISFSTFNATSPFASVNATFKSSWSIAEEGNNSVFQNFSYQDTTETNSIWDFCITPNSTNYKVSAEIEIDSSLHAKNFYYLVNATYNGTGYENISLYLLQDSLATLTEFEVTNIAQQPLSNTYISIQYYDLGTDTFYNIGMMKTSSDGKDLTYLNWYDSLYKFVLSRNGEVIYQTTPYKISETPQIFEVPTTITYSYAKFRDFQYSLTFNETSKNFILTFVKPSGDVDSGCLRVTKRNVTGDYQVCNTCETSSSATLYCSVANQGNGTFISTFYATGSLITLETLVEYIGVQNELFEAIGNEDGTIMAVIVAGMSMAFFLVSPIAGVVGILLGMLASFALGFQPLQMGTFIGVVCLGILVIWGLKK